MKLVFIIALLLGVAGCATQSHGHDHDHDHAHAHEAPDVEFRDDMDVQEISKAGEDVDIASHLVMGKVTVVDFGAQWCGPCKDVDALLFKLLDVHQDIAVRKIDVGNWDSPVALKHLKNVPQLPYVQVFDKRGMKVDAISGLDLQRLEAAIKKGQDS